MSLLNIRNLSVDFQTSGGQFRAVDGVDVTVDQGDVLAIVGNPARANPCRCWP